MAKKEIGFIKLQIHEKSILHKIQKCHNKKDTKFQNFENYAFLKKRIL